MPTRIRWAVSLLLSTLCGLTSRGQITQVAAINPSAANVFPGGTVTFRLVNAQPSATVVWFMNSAQAGYPGNLAVVGDRTTALYTAPNDATTVTSVTITACFAKGATVGSDETTACTAVPPVSAYPPSASASVIILAPQCVSPPGSKTMELGCSKIGYANRPSSNISSIPLLADHSVALSLFLVERSSSVTGTPIVAKKWLVNGVENGNEDVGTVTLGTSDKVATYKAPKLSASNHQIVSKPIVLSAIRVEHATPITLNILILPKALVTCDRGGPPGASANTGCDIIDFDRLNPDKLDPTAPLNSYRQDAGILNTINSAKTLAQGSVLAAKITDLPGAALCGNYDWKVVVQSRESTSVLIYDPSDIGSGVCEGDRFIVALPVHALWADIFAYPQYLDPTRPPPAKPTPPTDCMGQPVLPTIIPCDYGTVGIVRLGYRLAPLLYRFAPPGNGQGSVNYAGKGEVSFDAQADPAFKLGPGWLNFPTMFERGAANANLNSLTFAAAYDFRWLKTPNLYGSLGDGWGFILRKPEIQVSSGPEFSPSHPSTGMAPTLQRDWNYVWGEYVRLPLVFNLHEQPSSFTYYPVIGAEEGTHLISNLNQDDAILRGVIGGDASLRWPLNLTHNFVGPTPISFEAQFRLRGLVNKEPFADFADLPNVGTPPPCPNRIGVAANPSGTACIASLVLTSVPRSFFKGDATIPLDPYISIKGTVYRGSLPPDFWRVGWSYTLGISFSNPGSAEH
jgi:hypothetical protein